MGLGIRSGAIDDEIAESYCDFMGDCTEDFARDRMENLRKTEWERWLPSVSGYRFIKDFMNNDIFLLAKMYKTGYTISNISYSISTSAVGFAGLLAYAIINLR